MSNRGRHRKKHINSSWLIQLLGKDVVLKMMQNQIRTGNPPNIEVFERNAYAGKYEGGFGFMSTPESSDYWYNIAEKIRNDKRYNGR